MLSGRLVNLGLGSRIEFAWYCLLTTCITQDFFSNWYGLLDYWFLDSTWVWYCPLWFWSNILFSFFVMYLMVGLVLELWGVNLVAISKLHSDAFWSETFYKKWSMENKDSLYIENEKKQRCERTTDRNTYNKNYVKLNTTLSIVFYLVVCILIFLLFYCLVVHNRFCNI